MSSCVIYFHSANKVTMILPKTPAELLGCKPDIACYAKLMTGGMIPLAVTLATDALFDSFSRDPKVRKVEEPSSCFSFLPLEDI